MTHPIFHWQSVPVEQLPKVSVITPSYNQGQFIERTILSVLAQSYPHVEFVIFDGGSTDNTVDVLKKYENKLRWVSEKDDGQADAVNRGLASTDGEIIAWINSDDTYEPDALSYIVDCFLKNPDRLVVYGNANYIDKEEGVIRRYAVEAHADAQAFIDRLAMVCFICQPATFFRRELVELVGPLNPSIHTCMDYEYWMRAAKKTQFYYLPMHLANARMYLENKTLGQRVLIYQEIIQSILNHYNYVPFYCLAGYADYLVHRDDQFFNPGVKLNLRLLLLFIYFLFRYNLPRRQGRAYLCRFFLNSKEAFQLTKDKIASYESLASKWLIRSILKIYAL